MASKEEPRLVQLGDIPEIIFDGVAKAEEVLGGACVCLHLYRIRKPLDGEGPVEHELVGTLVTTAVIAAAFMGAKVEHAWALVN